MSTHVELMPCSNCGARAHIEPLDTYYGNPQFVCQVVCNGCYNGEPVTWARTEQAVAELWNTKQQELIMARAAHPENGDYNAED